MDAYLDSDAIWLAAMERVCGAVVHDHDQLAAYYAALGFEAVDARRRRGWRRVPIEFMP